MVRNASSPGGASTSNSGSGGGGGARGSAPSWSDLTGDEAHLRSAIERAFPPTMTFGDGFTVKLEDAGRRGSRGPNAVTMTVYDKNGRFAGQINRSFYETGGVRTVDNELLNLTPAARGKGFGSAFTKYAEKTWRAAGIQQMKVHAALQDGGYAWARAGYRWDDGPGMASAGMKNIASRASKLARAVGTSAADKVTLQGVAKRLRAAAKASTAATTESARRAANDAAPSPQDLSRLTGTSGTLASDLLRGSNWYGVKDL